MNFETKSPNNNGVGIGGTNGIDTTLTKLFVGGLAWRTTVW